MIFTGQQPAKDIPGFVQAADVLVSPRIRGTNTPLKIYSYLRSGKPIIATNLLTHTQVLNDRVARLVPVDAGQFAAAIGELINRPDIGQQLSGAASALAAAKYSREVYLRRTADAYRRLIAGAGGSGEAGSAGESGESGGSGESGRVREPGGAG